MKPLLITTAATTIALIVVLSQRLIIPALIVVFKSIEAGFAPDEVPALQPVVVTEAPKAKSRRARRRKPSAQTLAAIDALA